MSCHLHYWLFDCDLFLQPKKAEKDLSEEDLAFKAKQQAEAKALKAAADKMKGKK